MDRPSELIERARGATGLDDFGGGDFREGLDRLVASLDREARLSERGRIGTDIQIVDLLGNRLRVEHMYRLHSETATEASDPRIALAFGVSCNSVTRRTISARL